ncbi:MAG: hypothetical protein KBD64_08225 [Gammaproteobacteria bacterium]|nr:hypothetical protein [Gammaproteobacteria bacterium]
MTLAYPQILTIDQTLQKDLILIQQTIAKLLEPVIASIKTDTKTHLQSKILSKFSLKLSRSNILLSLLDKLNKLDKSAKYQATKNNATIYCVIIELLNLATKIHNIITDEHTTNSKITKISVPQAILFGDLIFTIAFEQIAEINNLEVIQIFFNSAKTMVLNEAKLSAFQPHHKHDLDIVHLIAITEDKYWPLYNQILYLLGLTQNNKIILLLKQINKVSTLNKIINQEIIFNNQITQEIYFSSRKNIYLAKLTEILKLTKQNLKNEKFIYNIFE